MTDTEATVIVDRDGALGHIELNKPKAINALSTEMIEQVDRALIDWQDDDSVAAVLITGAGERGLCAGGDIKGIYRSVVDGTDESELFFSDEYRMNNRIANYPKPYIAFMDGITMGGGVGVSVHGSVRIVTETTKVGMPETGIGLFPDVGGTYLLARLPHEIGMYMGLTGEPVRAGAALAYGLADHFVPRAQLPALRAALTEAPAEAPEVAADFAAQFAAEAPENELARDEQWIATCFAQDSVLAIIAALRAEGSEAAAHTADVLESKSPRSLAVTFEMIRTAKTMSLQEVLERDYRAALNIAHYPDLREGIRAQVIDKDRNPQWDPAAVSALDEAEIRSILDTERQEKVFS
ncbi:enoyl-CoA hydratase/isomerase family protein [Brevibacterium sp. 5221]|uniref:3-hydroxyisobutyryl-CoA hydrolase n=1 Tax=Brevibacterium rongguiense TaxID=2695267 RepID=A0A6N9H3W3_9MICO|nr:MULTISPECIES: enoyl-CoA hydratase/isomerase family protein [Brevibacterium]MYM18757.1 enoyl-CoA hydratase/isomerase family protein [Brevibacterium rongguiense]WAL40247.1 enoyl-CoA hydratase/isomerase family protein [Brevibacterium sp. BRM-1]